MKKYYLEINLDELAYSLHNRSCAKLPGASISLKIVDVEPEEDQESSLLDAQKSLLPSWRFNPCSCAIEGGDGNLH